MSTHRLRQLGLPGCDEVLALVPEFELYRLGRVVRMNFRDASSGLDGPPQVTFEVCAQYVGDTRRGIVALTLAGVTSVTIPQLTPSFFLGELEIADVSRDQLEGVRYRVADHGMSHFEVLCKAVSIRWYDEDPSSA